MLDSSKVSRDLVDPAFRSLHHARNSPPMNKVDFRFEVISRLRLHENIFLSLMHFNKRLRHIKGVPLVNSQTELVIEGYFRCANTFAALAFAQAQERRTRIANHTHAPASIDRAVRLGIPVLVLIRDPAGVAVSHVLKYPGLNLIQSLKWYCLYYQHLWRHHGSLVVADFAQVTTDFGEVIRRVNHRFGTNFTLFEHSKENVARVFKRIHSTDHRLNPNDVNQLSIPDPNKDQAKVELRQELQSSRTKPWLVEAMAVYERYLSLCM